MADVLSQSEVDALLQAVSGEEDGGAADMGDEPTAAAAPAFQAGGAAAKPKPTFNDTSVVIYDFKRPNRISADQMRALSSLHEQFARNLAAEFTGVFRTVIDIQSSQAEQLTYQEFTMSLPNPTYITTLSCEPLSGEMILELNPTICFPFIDKLLGGGHSATAAPERPFTDIESKLISQIMDHVIHHLQDTWEPVAHLRFTVTDNETNPQILQNVAPNEIVVLLTFEIRMSEGEAGGMLNLCIPFNVIEPIMMNLTSQSWFIENAKTAKVDLDRLNENVQDVSLELEAMIAETTISLEDLSQMKVGDIIPTPKLSTHDILINIAGKPKYKASIGKIRGHKAIRIEDKADETDQINF